MRHESDERPLAPIVIQRRDLAILRDVGKQRCLTATLVAWVHFPGRLTTPVEDRARPSSAVSRRLKKLSDCDALRTVRRPVRIGDGSPTLAYALGARGAALLARHGEPESAALATQRGDRLDPLFLDHTLAVAQVWAALTAACARKPAVHLADWQGESALKRRVLAQRSEERRLGLPPEPALMPDATFRLALGDNATGPSARYFVEVDRGTADSRDIRDKILRYADELRSGRHAARYGAGRPFILWVATGERRLRNALRTIGSVLEKEPELAGRVFGAELATLLPGTALGPIWMVAGSGERRALLRRGV